MKTFKIILAVLLLIALLPTSGCVFSQIDTELEEDLGSIPVHILTEEEKVELPNALDKVKSNRSSLSFLIVCHFVFILSAGIVLLALKKKYYSALLSGGLVLVPYIWNASLQKAIAGVADDIKNVACKTTLPYIEESLESYENVSGLSVANLMLFVPMAVLLVIGLVEVLVHCFRKNKNSAPVDEVQPEPMPKETNIDDIKKYKELLDQGIITQEEFDVKKKELLGL